jgi:hypothetical protein
MRPMSYFGKKGYTTMWTEQDAHAISKRLQQYLAQLSRWFPDVWSQIDNFRAVRGKGLPNWPNWCFLPMSGAYAIATQGRDVIDLDPATREGLWIIIPEIAALAAWRPTQGIYRFHREVFSALWETPSFMRQNDLIPVFYPVAPHEPGLPSRKSTTRMIRIWKTENSTSAHRHQGEIWKLFKIPCRSRFNQLWYI